MSLWSPTADSIPVFYPTALTLVATAMPLRAYTGLVVLINHQLYSSGSLSRARKNSNSLRLCALARKRFVLFFFKNKLFLAWLLTPTWYMVLPIRKCRMCCEHESKAFLFHWLDRCSAAVSEGIRTGVILVLEGTNGRTRKMELS